MISAWHLLWIIPVSFVAGMTFAVLIEALGQVGEAMYKWERKQ